MKKERMIAEDTIKVQKFIIMVLAGALIAFITIMSINLHRLSNKLKDETSTNIALNNEITTLSASINELTNNLSIMTKVSVELEENNNKLISDNKALANEWDEINTELVSLQERAELYNKYEYIITFAGKRTDVDYEDLKHLEEIAEELGLTQDAIDLCLAFVMNESAGNEKAKNPSGASGLGQLMPSTGKYAWDHLMPIEVTQGRPYDHSTIPFDGSLNLEMALRLIAYLDTYHKNNATAVVSSYCGGWSDSYVARLNYILQKGPTPTTVQTMKIHL